MEKTLYDITAIVAAIAAQMGTTAPQALLTLLAALEKRDYAALDAQRRAGG